MPFEWRQAVGRGQGPRGNNLESSPQFLVRFFTVLGVCFFKTKIWIVRISEEEGGGEHLFEQARLFGEIQYICI